VGDTSSQEHGSIESAEQVVEDLIVQDTKIFHDNVYWRDLLSHHVYVSHNPRDVLFLDLESSNSRLALIRSRSDVEHTT
jgi:hypothetical protein